MQSSKNYYFGQISDIPERFEPTTLNVIAIGPYRHGHFATLSIHVKSTDLIETVCSLYIDSDYCHMCIRPSYGELCICDSDEITIFSDQGWNTKEGYKEKVLKYKDIYDMNPKDWVKHRF